MLRSPAGWCGSTRSCFPIPAAINLDKYGAGWLFEIEGPGDTLLDPPGYIEHLAAVWEITQRTIKGQMNE